jgi:membrane protein
MGTLKDTVQQFFEDNCPRMAAALSYYAVFSLPGLLLLVLLMAGLVADPALLRQELTSWIAGTMGPEAAEQAGAIMREVERPGGNVFVFFVGAGALLFAATGAFAQLQHTLNRAWRVEPDPARGGLRNFLVKRVVSFAMILGVALLLLVSLLLQTLLAAFGDLIALVLPDPAVGMALRAASFAVSLGVATLLFALIFQVLPDAVVRWHDAWRGGLATAVLFLAGNVALGMYLARSEPGSAYGAAGSLALILIWIYYSSMIVFFGAELTQVLARSRGEPIRPAPGAVRVVIERKALPEEPGT